MKGKTLKVGEAVITSAYALPNDVVIHTVGPDCRIDEQNQKREKLLESAIINSFKLLCEYGFKSIAFCAISTGIYKYDTKEAAKVFAKVFLKVCKDQENFPAIHTIKMVNFEQEKTDIFI